MNDVQRSWCYWDEKARAYVYRASSLGGCIRSLVAARLGESAFPPGQHFRKAMDASGGLESEVLRRFMEEVGDGLISGQQQTVELKLSWDDEPLVIVRGHIDADYDSASDAAVIEVKVFGDNYWERWISGKNVLERLDNLPGFLGQKYRIQGGIYGHAKGKKVQYVIGHKVKVTERFEMPGLNLDPEELATWVVSEIHISPPIEPERLYPVADLHARIQFIEECAMNDELPPCDQNCRESDPYGEAHLFARPKTADNDLTAKLLRIEELKTIVGTAERDKNGNRQGLLGELEDLKDEVKNTYGNDLTPEKITAGPLTASIVPMPGRESIDGKKLRKLYPDIAAECLKIGQPYRVLTIRRSKSDEGEE